MKFRNLLLAAVPVLSAVGVAAVSKVNAAPPSNTNNVTICHRTHSTTNPYVRITVDQNSVGSGNSKHGGGAHDLWATSLYGSKPNPNVYDSTKTYPANDKKWGDIIAFLDVSGNALTGNAYQVRGLNNTGIGADIFNGTNGQAGKCGVMNARDYYEVERAAGVPATDVLADMNEFAADEFATELSACGGTFTGCNPSTLGTTSISIVTTTTVATTVAPTTTVRSNTSSTPTTTQPPALQAGKGGLIVNIWIDANRDDKKTSTEPYYAGVKVTIVGPGGVTKTGTTDANGSVTFDNLDPGSWVVEPTLSDPSLSKVYDSDGTDDWKSTSTVVAGTYAKEFYAAAGTAVIQIPDGKASEVTVKWAGPDNKLDTQDDVVFVAKRTSGVVRAAGLPAGKYAISSTGSFSGAFVTATAVAGKTVTASIATLAATGSSSTSTLVVTALLMLLAGALVLVSRRRLMN